MQVEQCVLVKLSIAICYWAIIVFICCRYDVFGITCSPAKYPHLVQVDDLQNVETKKAEALACGIILTEPEQDMYDSGRYTMRILCMTCIHAAWHSADV